VFGHSATHKRRQSFTVKRLAAFIVIAAHRVFSLPTLHVAFVGEESRNRKLGKIQPGVENSYQP
jgi:hypothetical protein